MPATPSYSNRARFSLNAALVTQMSTGPAFREVATLLLHEHLRERYPTLHIDPDIALVGFPSWYIHNGTVIPGLTRYQPLSDVLAKQAVLGVPALYIEGEHFLTQTPLTDPPMHLPVRISEIANLINELTPVMIRGYQQAQLDYWNRPQGESGPRWHELSNVLRDFWDVRHVSGWTEEDRRMVQQVRQTPDLAQRRLNDPYDTHAYMLDVHQTDDEGKTTHLNEHIVTVIIGKQQGREVILVYSLLQGYRKFSSLEELGNHPSIFLNDPAKHGKISWRLLEPEGDFFDQVACAVIGVQIDVIGELDFLQLRGHNDMAPLAAPPNNQAKQNGPGLEWFRRALPDWMRNAETADLDAYSRHIKDLAALNSLNQGQSYQDGIAPIRQYALEQLAAEMLKDHADATNLNLEELEIQIQSPVVWGLFTVPGRIETTVFSLADLALQNLIALPVGIKFLRQKVLQQQPDWLTVEYLETLITRVDIGATYPRLIRTTLLDDPQESIRRESLYTQHLRIQLPLLALQLKIRQDEGFDERGYRYVAAVMQPDADNRKVDGQAIVLRRLAFVPSRRLPSTADTVANMFVIAPQDMTAGPCILYRPLLDHALSQYPSAANLMYAIQQSDSMRESVLAWLPDTARTDYSRYVFPGALPSPWAVVESLVDPIKLLMLSGPLTLGTQVLEGDWLATLYKDNANALVELADRQSVSNAEARWATFKRAGWAIFNASLPFLGHAIGAAAWIWQIMDQLQEVVDAQEHSDQQASRTALTDLLLNLGMAIALHSASRTAIRHARRLELSEKPVPQLPRKPSAPKELVITKLPDTTSQALGSDHAQPIYTSGALNRTPERLGIVLDRFKVDKPATLGQPIAPPGEHQHLYPSGSHYYAPVGERWFRVHVDENDSVLIVDEKQPERTGPPLIHNRQGQWFIDTRMRLRGAGPKVLAKKARILAQKRADELRKQLSDFEGDKLNAQRALRQARETLDAAPSTSETARQAYAQTLETQCSDYESALQKLKELSLHAPVPDYLNRALGYVKAQTELTGASMRETLNEFTPKLRAGLDQIEHQSESPQDRKIDEAQQLSTLNRDMIHHLDYMQTRFTELEQLSKDGKRLISATKSTLPAYTSDDLKALQVAITRNLCLPQETTTTAPQAWLAIDRIVDSAEISIQCLRETLREQSEVQLDARIDTLSSLVEQFQLLDERLQDFPEEYSQQAIPEQLQSLRDQLAAFKRRATNQLGLLSAERDIVRSRPTPPATPPRSERKFIRTRFNGQLIGEPRLTDITSQTWMVDVRSPLTNQVVATFHEKTPGIWVERLRTPKSSPSPIDVQTSISRGQALLDEHPKALQRIATHTLQSAREPIGIEHAYHQLAAKLEHAASAIEQALTQSNMVESDAPSATIVKKALLKAVSEIYQLSNQKVLRAIKQHPPTVASVEWLKNHNAISIKKTVTRRRLKSAKPDYLDEYTIIDRQTEQALWYAHFHYSTSWTPAKAYLTARLKTLDEYRQGAAADTLRGLTDAQKVDFIRSQISLEPARELFFERPKSESRD